MKIGILLAGHVPSELHEKQGDYASMFRRLLAGREFEFETFDIVDNQFPSSVNDCDGWLITGSRHGAYDDLPFIAPLEAFIREAYAKNLPMIGVCFGHQVIAQSLGGTVEKYADGWAVGKQQYDWAGGPIALNAWHQDQVVTKPKEARVVASNDFCRFAALAYQDKIFTVQAHPEFNAEVVTTLAETRGRGVVPDELLDEALSQTDETIDQNKLANLFETFFKTREVAQ